MTGDGLRGAPTAYALTVIHPAQIKGRFAQGLVESTGGTQLNIPHCLEFAPLKIEKDYRDAADYSPPLAGGWMWRRVEGSSRSICAPSHASEPRRPSGSGQITRQPLSHLSTTPRAYYCTTAVRLVSRIARRVATFLRTLFTASVQWLKPKLPVLASTRNGKMSPPGQCLAEESSQGI